MVDKSNRDLQISTRDDLIHTSPGLEHKDVSAGEGVADLLHAAAYSGLQKPIDGIVQLANHVTSSEMKAPEVVSKLDHENTWTQAGSIAGAVGDFYLLSKGVGVGRQQFLGRAASVPLLEAGATGAMYELVTPTGDKDFATNKLRNMAVGFGTFATMDGAATKLRGMSWVGNADGFLGSIKVGGLSGVAGGVAHSVLDSSLRGELPNYYDVGKDMAQFGTFGAMFGGVDGAVKSGYHGYREVSTRISDRAANGEALFSIAGIEVHPKGFAQQAREMAFTDGLTGLKNKAFGEEALKSEVARANREGEPLSMTFLDLDNFKTVNDKIGHQHGDLVLKEVADQITGHFRRDTDVHIREGGDEFMILMPNTEYAHASEVAGTFENQMRVAASKEPIKPEQLAQNFPAELAKLKGLDRQVNLSGGETLWDVANELLTKRAAITGETVSEKSLASEVKRLSERTGFADNVPLKPGQPTVYSEADIMALGEKTAYRFVPQIGQLLKMNGIATEAQIQEVLQMQANSAGPTKPLIGELLVKKGYATNDQVNALFREQNAIKTNLRSAADNALNDSHLVPTMNSQNPLPDSLTSPMQIARLRSLIPEVPRPMLSTNGIRRLQLHENPVTGEVVVGVSTGVVELSPSEEAAAFKQRGDHMMFDKKGIRKRMGLRHDRNEAPADVEGLVPEMGITGMN
jgi:diguanylate cyclase (GGDEF)-like protein